jgi:hypothetical protein
MNTRMQMVCFFKKQKNKLALIQTNKKIRISELIISRTPQHNIGEIEKILVEIKT